MAPFISVVVPVRNGQRTIGDCVTSLLRMDYPPERREILVVDNGSSDGTVRTVRSHPVTLLHERERSAAAARNAGILAARGQILAFTDADCVVSVQWARELVRAFGDERVGGVEGETMDYPPTTRVERYIARRRPFSYDARRVNALAPFVITANVAFRRDVFDRVGLFDTRFAGAGGEDIDFTWRFVGETDLELRYSPRAILLPAGTGRRPGAISDSRHGTGARWPRSGRSTRNDCPGAGGRRSAPGVSWRPSWRPPFARPPAERDPPRGPTTTCSCRSFGVSLSGWDSFRERWRRSDDALPADLERAAPLDPVAAGRILHGHDDTEAGGGRRLPRRERRRRLDLLGCALAIGRHYALEGTVVAEGHGERLGHDSSSCGGWAGAPSVHEDARGSAAHVSPTTPNTSLSGKTRAIGRGAPCSRCGTGTGQRRLGAAAGLALDGE